MDQLRSSSDKSDSSSENFDGSSEESVCSSDVSDRSAYEEAKFHHLAEQDLLQDVPKYIEQEG